VPALLVFYGSFGLENTVLCEIQRVKMPPILSKLKGEKNTSSYTTRVQADSLQSCFPLPIPSHLPFLL
jgi:hypothetical protein